MSSYTLLPLHLSEAIDAKKVDCPQVPHAGYRFAKLRPHHSLPLLDIPVTAMTRYPLATARHTPTPAATPPHTPRSLLRSSARSCRSFGLCGRVCRRSPIHLHRLRRSTGLPRELDGPLVRLLSFPQEPLLFDNFLCNLAGNKLASIGGFDVQTPGDCAVALHFSQKPLLVILVGFGVARGGLFLWDGRVSWGNEMESGPVQEVSGGLLTFEKGPVPKKGLLLEGIFACWEINCLEF